MSGSITYRYRCETEGALVWEARTEGQAPPTQCVNDGGALTTGSLVIVDRPLRVGDIIVENTANFTTSDVSNLSHTELEDVGTNTHAQIDSHIADASVHRTIADGSAGATDLWSASKISSELSGKSATGHTHAASQVTDFTSAVDARISAQKAQANGLATLGADSKIPASQLPSLSLTSVTVVADISARNALTVEMGDVAKVTDAGSGYPQTYIYDGSVWVDIQESSDVISVNGKTGVVSLTTSDISEGTNKYYTEARVAANSDVGLNTTHRGATSNPHSVTLAQTTTALALGKGDLIGHNGTTNVKVAAGTDGGVLQADSTQATGVKWATNKKFIVCSGTTTVDKDTWTQVDELVYPGASITAANVSRILVNAEADTGVTYDIRAYDVSGGNVVASKTGQTNANPAIINMGTLSNIPSTDALLEIQIKRTAGAGTASAIYHSLMLEYQ